MNYVCKSLIPQINDIFYANVTNNSDKYTFLPLYNNKFKIDFDARNKNYELALEDSIHITPSKFSVYEPKYKQYLHVSVIDKKDLLKNNYTYDQNKYHYIYGIYCNVNSGECNLTKFVNGLKMFVHKSNKYDNSYSDEYKLKDLLFNGNMEKLSDEDAYDLLISDSSNDSVDLISNYEIGLKIGAILCKNKIFIENTKIINDIIENCIKDKNIIIEIMTTEQRNYIITQLKNKNLLNHMMLLKKLKLTDISKSYDIPKDMIKYDVSNYVDANKIIFTVLKSLNF